MLPDITGSVVVDANRLTRRFGDNTASVNALIDVSLSVQRGEVVALMGPSGCGKTTLLHLLGGLDVPDAGTVLIEGADWSTLPAKTRAQLRRRQCGFVFQSLGLLPMATAFENVDVPLLLDGRDGATRRRYVESMLDQVGLAGKASQFPDQLSGGEQQRVAIARALVHSPAVVLADEPTGSLDSATAMEVTALLVGAARSHNAAVVLVTHDERVAAHADRVLRLDSGRVLTQLTGAHGASS